ncbi:Bax inhibitor-1/YccA family membrane protein [Glutamicibacter endophyticus]|uniref:Bax inhibitor-1/YccA family membrane protein n=1 Tax=Glutamicibacter endophyticus TaxID=1522174 RepID=UPI003AF146F9
MSIKKTSSSHSTLAIGRILKISLAFFVVLHPAALIGVIWTVAPAENRQTLDGSTPIAWIFGALVFLFLIFQAPVPSRFQRIRIISFVFIEGLFLGGFVTYFESLFPGTMLQLSFAAFSAFIGALVMLSIPGVRRRSRTVRVLLTSITGYGAFVLHNLGVADIGTPIIKPWGLVPDSVLVVPPGLVLALLLIPVTSRALVLKTERAQTLPVADTEALHIWYEALGLVFTIVWPSTKTPFGIATNHRLILGQDRHKAN